MTIDRRSFLKIGLTACAASTSGCFWRIDPFHTFVRSPYIETYEEERRILALARLDRTEDGRIRVLHVQGTPYERGYQQGKLLQAEVSDNLQFLYDTAVDKFHFEELFSEVYERMRPYIPQEYIDEMHGLAHGARLPLHVLHGIHVLPEIGEWGGRKRLEKIFKSMFLGEFATMCSNFSAAPGTTKDGRFFAVRILDWGLHRISKLHKYPLLTVVRPQVGHDYVNIGWCGFLGLVSGMNDQGITIGEMGYRDPEGETLFGMPMPFLLREVARQASSLADVRRIISTTRGTNSFAYLMSDGKTKEAELYVRDPNRFDVFKPGEDIKTDKGNYPAIDGISYAGKYDAKMTELLTTHSGEITLEAMQKTIIPGMVMPSNFQNVIYEPDKLVFWVNNAKSKHVSAVNQPYSFFDLGEAVKQFPK